MFFSKKINEKFIFYLNYGNYNNFYYYGDLARQRYKISKTVPKISLTCKKTRVLWSERHLLLSKYLSHYFYVGQMNFYDLVNEKYKDEIINWLNQYVERKRSIFDHLRLADGLYLRCTHGNDYKMDDITVLLQYLRCLNKTCAADIVTHKYGPVMTNIYVNFQDVSRIPHGGITSYTKNLVEYVNYRLPAYYTIAKNNRPRTRIRHKNKYNEILQIMLRRLDVSDLSVEVMTKLYFN
jgi:hypothetical protein